MPHKYSSPLLCTKSNFQIANLNFVTPKRFGTQSVAGRSTRLGAVYKTGGTTGESQSYFYISPEKTITKHHHVHLHQLQPTPANTD